MTNQNVVVSDASSGIKMAIKLAITSSITYPSSAQKPPPSPGSYITISRKFPMKIETIETTSEPTASKINAWVDSMRASSPTHARVAASISDARDYTSWMLSHPSALVKFEQIKKASEGKQIILFMDYDGTLSPIVEDPDKAFMSKEMRGAVRNAARHFPTAIVTGRCMDKVCNFVRLGELYYAGSHGMDIKGPATKTLKYKKNNPPMAFQPAKEFLPMIDEVYKILVEKTKSTQGAKVESNKFCLSVHFRCVDEKSWAALAEQVKLVLNDYPKLKLTIGRKVLEVRPAIKWDKGKALEFLLESLGYGNSDDVFPVYIGDDRTDEDAFKVLRDRGHGLGIIVSKVPKETSASYSLQEPSEVMVFLQRLVEWKKMSLRG
uniref:Trehalose 6-phosphate phosphatase n=1 Tax=Kalanchoe fedtschenkoi TaxID=63787 RepID=A0A7N0UM15_KALFE